MRFLAWISFLKLLQSSLKNPELSSYCFLQKSCSFVYIFKDFKVLYSHILNLSKWSDNQDPQQKNLLLKFAFLWYITPIQRMFFNSFSSALFQPPGELGVFCCPGSLSCCAMVWIVAPSPIHVKALTPDVMVFGDNRFLWGQRVGPLWPYKKKDTRELAVPPPCLSSLQLPSPPPPCEDTVSRWQSVQARRKALHGSQPCWHLYLGLLVSRTVRK